MISKSVIGIGLEAIDSPSKLEELVDEFRTERSAEELHTLLSSSNQELVRIGAWIASEIPFERYNSKAILDNLRHATRHSSPAIRMYAFSAIFPSLEATDPDSRELLHRLRNDENPGVRMTAEAAASSLAIR